MASFDLVTYLGSRLSAKLIEARVQNVDALAGVRTLDLRECRGITDISALGGVHTLNLRGCAGITDVSTLGGVHTLTLEYCSAITDVSALGGVQHTLTLTGCEGITDVSVLGGQFYAAVEIIKDGYAYDDRYSFKESVLHLLKIVQTVLED
jgi:hypothetical protein